MLGVQMAFEHTIVPRGRGRGDLAHPVRHDRERALVRIGGALTSPAGEVGPHDIVRGQLDIDLGKDVPAPRAAETIVVVEGTAEHAAEHALHLGIARPRRRQRPKHAPDHFALLSGR